MKVLSLQCANRHPFEGWFASEDDFQSQLAGGLVECPMCCDRGVQKMPSAPRLNLGGHHAADSGRHNLNDQPGQSPRTFELALQTNATAPATVQAPLKQPIQSVTEQAAFFTALRQMVSSTEDVGDRFALEARAMHYGDTEVRSIRGQASRREALELLQEGIDVLPLPPQLKETLQ